MPFEPKVFAVYIMTNRRDGVLYVGVTSDLPTRAVQHKAGLIDGFTKRYNLKRLVWCRWFHDADQAIKFEKQLKRWRRDWKLQLIEEMNPGWDDLLPDLMGADFIGPLSHLQGR